MAQSYKNGRSAALVRVAVLAILVSGCSFEISEMPEKQPQSGRISFMGTLVKASQKRQSDSTALLCGWNSQEAGAVVAMKEPMAESVTKGGRLLSLQDFVGFGYIYDVSPGDCNYFSSELFSLENGQFVSENEYNVVSTASNTRVMAIGPASVLDSECSIINTSFGVVFSCITPEKAVEQKDIVVADTGPVPGTAGGGIAFSHIMSSVNFVSSSNVPQCHIDSIRIASVDLYGEYEFMNGWGALSQQGTVTVISDIDIEEGQAGVPLHESEQAPMLIPQTLGSDSKLILYVTKADEHFVLQCPLDGLQLSQGDVITLSLDFDVKTKVLKVVTGTGTVDLSSYVADGYNCMDFFIVNGGNGGAGSTINKYKYGTGYLYSPSPGAGGTGGNTLTVNDIRIDSDNVVLSVAVGGGGAAGAERKPGGAGGVSSVTYGENTYSPPANNGTSNNVYNPFNSADQSRYGVSGTSGEVRKGGKNGTTYNGYGAGGGGGRCTGSASDYSDYYDWPGSSGRAGVVIIQFRCASVLENE